MKAASTADFVRTSALRAVLKSPVKFQKDGKLKLVGKTHIDTECCVHCGWCAAVCPVNAIFRGKAL